MEKKFLQKKKSETFLKMRKMRFQLFCGIFEVSIFLVPKFFSSFFREIHSFSREKNFHFRLILEIMTYELDWEFERIFFLSLKHWQFIKILRDMDLKPLGEL